LPTHFSLPANAVQFAPGALRCRGSKTAIRQISFVYRQSFVTKFARRFRSEILHLQYGDIPENYSCIDESELQIFAVDKITDCDPVVVRTMRFMAVNA
jgi:hypothetical protein